MTIIPTLFFITYIEISLFIRVAEVLGITVTLLLMVFTSCIGVSLVRNQGIKTFIHNAAENRGGRKVRQQK